MSKRLEPRQVLDQAAKILADREDPGAWKDNLDRFASWVLKHGGRKALRALYDELGWKLEAGP